jgi:O-antigen ligase
VVGGAASYLKAGDTVQLNKIQSIKERVTQNRAAWMMFAESPLTGKGPNYFYKHFVQYRRAVWFSNPPQRVPERAAHQAHNDYIQLLAEGGLLVALPITIILALLLREQFWFFRRILNEPKLSQSDLLTIGAVGGFWAIAINSVGNFPFHVAPLAVAALFWAALSHHLIRERAGG